MYITIHKIYCLNFILKTNLIKCSIKGGKWYYFCTQSNNNSFAKNFRPEGENFYASRF